MGLDHWMLSLVGRPVGGPASVRRLAAMEIALTAKAATRGPSAPTTLLYLPKDPSGGCVCSCSLPRPGDDWLQPWAAQLVCSGIGGRSGDHPGQSGGNVTVSRVCEVDRVLLLPDGDVSWADKAGHVPVSISKAVFQIKDDATREGGLRTASAACYGRNKDLAIIFVLSIFQVGFVPAELAGDVVAKWKTAYQGRGAASLMQGGQLLPPANRRGRGQRWEWGLLTSSQWKGQRPRGGGGSWLPARGKVRLGLVMQRGFVS